MHVVVVDDERRMVALVTSYLEEAGFTTTGCFDGTQALAAARTGEPDVMVLDLMLPGISGLEVCRRIRAEGLPLPILMLTARGAVPERVAGLEAGADDYLVKPFALEELVARLRVIGRRQQEQERARLSVGDVVLDPAEQRVWVGGIETDLGRREFTMLTELMASAGTVVSRQRLFDALWEGEVDIRSNALDVHMSRLRARLDASAQVSVTTLRGVGYRLEQVAMRPRGFWQRLVGGRPIVTRLVVAVAAAMALVLVLAAAFVYWRVGYALGRQLDQDLEAWRRVVERSVKAGEEPPGDTPGLYYQLYDDRARLLAGDEGLPTLLDAASSWRTAFRSGTTGAGCCPPRTHPYRVRLSRVTTPDGARVVASVISRSKHDEALRELLLQLAIADLLALAGASFVGYRTARAALNPVESYRRAAAEAGADPLDRQPVRRLPVAADRDDELSRLGHTFNDLLERIEESAERERQFLADASHELRTPLSLDEHRAGVGPPPAALARGDRRGDRLAAGPGHPARRPGQHPAGPRGAARRRARSPASRCPSPRWSSCARHAVPSTTRIEEDVADAQVHVHARWLAIALGNLLANAVRHGGEPIHLVATYDAPRLRLVVRDSGPGFPEEFAAQAFDRFSRAEASRTSPGSGLGMALVRAIAEAHDGTARILPGPGGAVEIDVDAGPSQATSRLRPVFSSETSHSSRRELLVARRSG